MCTMIMGISCYSPGYTVVVATPDMSQILVLSIAPLKKSTELVYNTV